MNFNYFIIPILTIFIFSLSCSDNPTSTQGTAILTDIDGNIYQTVKIGDQLWMAENLKVTHYRNGDPIPNVVSSSDWVNLTTGAYCNYDNNGGNVAIYGRLYNWYAVVDSSKIAPAGWHVPTDDELKELEIYLGMSQSEADGFGMRGTDEGGKMKESGTKHWNSPNAGATNESGFSGLPGGYRNYYGDFFNKGYIGFIWSVTEFSSHCAWVHDLHYKYPGIERFYDDKPNGFSVRCVRD